MNRNLEQIADAYEKRSEVQGIARKEFMDAWGRAKDDPRLTAALSKVEKILADLPVAIGAMVSGCIVETHMRSLAAQNKEWADAMRWEYLRFLRAMLNIGLGEDVEDPVLSPDERELLTTLVTRLRAEPGMN